MTQQLAQSALTDAPPVAALVNAAGVMLLGTTLDVPLEDWERSLAVNLTGVLLSSRAVIPHMRRGSGVVNIASVVALAAGRRRVAYAAAKAGVIGMTRAMALDHAADGIRVNVICPGAVETPMLHGAWAAVAPQTPAESMRAALEAGTPLGRVASPEDIADLIAFLCGPQSSFITGAVIPIDGGITAQLAASQAR
jgi:NAD(P)-dependent dehydrogenase (short-subunit alcohol dehydrogenase family)